MTLVSNWGSKVEEILYSSLVSVTYVQFFPFPRVLFESTFELETLSLELNSRLLDALPVQKRTLLLSRTVQRHIERFFSIQTTTKGWPYILYLGAKLVTQLSIFSFLSYLLPSIFIEWNFNHYLQNLEIFSRRIYENFSSDGQFSYLSPTQFFPRLHFYLTKTFSTF